MGEDAGADSLRGMYTIALLVCPGVDKEAIEGLVAGGSVPGFGVIKRDEVMNSEDDVEAAEKKKELEAEEQPVPPEIFARLLKGVMNRSVEGVDPLPEGDDPLSELLKVPRGPKQFMICPDMPTRFEEVEALVAGGGFDAVIMIQNDGGVDPAGEQGEEEGDKIISAREMWAFMNEYALKQTPAPHNPTADSTFLSVVDVAGSPQETLNAIATGLKPMVEQRVEYADWLKGVEIITSEPPPTEPDMRHYLSLLDDVPNSCTTVPLVLHSLCEQVALSAADADGSSQDERELWRRNRAVMMAAESGLSKLALESEWAEGGDGDHDGEGPTYHHADLNSFRRGEVTLGDRGREMMKSVEERMGMCLNIVGKMPAVGDDAAERDDAIFSQIPEMHPGRVRRALMLSEFEQMVGIACSEDGKPLPVKGWGEEKLVDIHDFCFAEELSQDVVQQQLAEAMLVKPEVLVRPYEREDGLLVALCNLVPKGRIAKQEWKTDMVAYLGFWQWRSHRLELMKKAFFEMGSRKMMQSNSILSSTHSDDGVKPSESAEGSSGDAEPESPAKPVRAINSTSMPAPKKPERLYDLDSTAVRRIVEDERVSVFPVAGEALTSWKGQVGRFTRCSVPGGNCITVKEDAYRRILVSIVYADGAVVSAGRCGINDASLQISVSTRSGLQATVRGGAVPVWMQRPRDASGRTEGKAASRSEWADEYKKLQEEAAAKGDEREEAAVLSKGVLRGGAVVVRKTDGTAECMMPDGCRGKLTVTGWEWTNSKGQRQGDDPRFPGERQRRDAIRVVSSVDGLTGDVCRTREDGVIVVDRPDGTRLTQHADGTRIVTLEGGETISTSAGFPDVKMGSGGSVSVTFPEGTVASVMGDGSEVQVKRPDGSLMTIKGQRLQEELVFKTAEGGALSHAGLGRIGGEELSTGQVAISMYDGVVKYRDNERVLYQIGDVTRVNTSNAKVAREDSDGQPILMTKSVSASSITIQEDHESEFQDDYMQDDETYYDFARSSPQLEPFRLICVRRDGTGYEMIHKNTARAFLCSAAAKGCEIGQSRLPDGGMRFNVSSKDTQWICKERETDRMFPASLHVRDTGPTEGKGTGGIYVRELNYHSRASFQELRGVRKALEASRVLFDRQAAAGEPPKGPGGGDAALSSFKTEIEECVARAREGAEARGAEAREIEAAMRAASIALPEPPMPSVQRPPARFPPSIFRGVVHPDDPAQLRPSYFDDGGGGAGFIASLPEGERSEGCTKSKIRAPPPTEMGSNFQEGDDEEYDGADQQIGAQRSYEYERVNTSGQDGRMSGSGRWDDDNIGGVQVHRSSSSHIGRASHSQPSQVPGGMRPPHYEGRPKPTTSYHVRNLRAAHYDVLNKPRKEPIPDTNRHDAIGSANEGYEVVEMPVRRHTHTSSVMQRSMLIEKKRLEGSMLDDDEEAEGSGTRMFRLRPRQASFGTIRAGGVFRHKLVITNVSVEKARYRVKQPTSDLVSVVYTPGGVAAGMSVVIEIEIYAEFPVEIDEELRVETEAEQFVIPIRASVLSGEDFAAWQAKGMQLPKHVKELQSGAPKKSCKSKQAPMATLVSLHDASTDASLMMDLQDTVDEPAAPVHSRDWVVDTTKTLNEIRDMTDEERMALIAKKERIRTGKLLQEDEAIKPTRTSSSLSKGGAATGQ